MSVILPRNLINQPWQRMRQLTLLNAQPESAVIGVWLIDEDFILVLFSWLLFLTSSFPHCSMPFFPQVTTVVHVVSQLTGGIISANDS